ncbi:MAG: LamG domain-containing protein, partial [Candidatus Marinimicrobia bacterium]|nr:LamG domain-containing protein [Candidatus Neomarinimicrobiota bacterium]
MQIYGSESSVGFNEQLDLSDSAPILGEQFTQEAWVYVDNTLSSPLERNIFSSPNITLRSASSLGNIYEIDYGFYSGSSHFETSVIVDIPLRSWFHMATTFDGTNYKLFINGQEINNYTGAAGNSPDATPARYIGENFLGGIDEIRMWSIARSQEQIDAAMGNTLTGNETGLLAYYPIGLNNNWEIVDHSPNNNHVPISHIVPNQPEVATRYFSESCPSPNGTSDCPYPTIRGALDRAQPADRVYIREGRYSELLSEYQLNQSPNSDHPYATPGPKITIEGYPNEDVKLDGTVPISADWEYHENGIYKAVLDMNAISQSINTPVDSIYGVFVDDRYMIPAMPINFKNPTDPTTGNPIAPEPGTVWEKRLPRPKNEGYWPGEYAYLDTVEEWSFDPSTSTLYLIPGENLPDQTNVRVRVRDRLLRFIHSDNIELKNIHFFAGSIRTYDVSYLTIEDCKFSFSSDVGQSKNYTSRGSYTTVRNCIFEYINDTAPWSQYYTMYPTIENVLFRYNDWFAASGNYVTTTTNNHGNMMGATVYRHVTIENAFTAGIYPGMNSLTEYCRFENLYEQIDGAGIQRNPISVVGSTSRYLWMINLPHINGMRFDGAPSGNNGDVHHVVSAGNRRGLRLKGDYHDVYHATSFDNSNVDISLPWNKYGGTFIDNEAGETILDDIIQNGNAHSNFRNSIAEYSLHCAAPDCWPSIEDLESWYAYGYSEGFDGEYYPSLPSHPFHLDSVGIWYGLPLDRSRPQFEMMDPWTYNRHQNPDSVIAEWGEYPWQDQRQSYDFRPRKGSSLVDNGVIIEGINDGQDITFNHAPMFPGQNRQFVGSAPDQGAYEYGDLVYWIPGYRYPHPSVPIPNNNAVEVPIDYSLVWNYPYKKDYNGTIAVVTLTGPGISRTETFTYPNNVFFETFQPGGAYNWSVTVDGISGGNWSFTVADKIYPLNDRSIDTTAVDSALIPLQPQNLEISKNNLAFLRFDIPITFYNNRTIHLNLIPENVSLSDGGGVIVYKFNYPEWGEGIDEHNIGLADHSLI